MIDAATIAEEIEREGYCVRPLLDAALVATLRDRWAALGVPADEPLMYRAFADEGRGSAADLDADLKELVAPIVAEILPSRRLVLATFIHKGPGGEPLDYHQDWTFCDERRHPTVLLWIPLTEVDQHNGGLGMVAGSHRWTNGLRTSSAEGSGATEHYQETLAARAHVPHLQPGDAIIYDARVIHGSGPNQSPEGRTALALVTVERGEPILHFHETDGRTEGFVVDEAYFTTAEFETRPDGYEPYPPWAAPVCAADFAPFVGSDEAR